MRMDIDKIFSVLFNQNHGWWNCEDCREKYHRYNLENVNAGMVQDKDGEHYSKKYLLDMKDWLLEKEMYEDVTSVDKLLEKRAIVFKQEGMPYIPSLHYSR